MESSISVFPSASVAWPFPLEQIGLLKSLLKFLLIRILSTLVVSFVKI